MHPITFAVIAMRPYTFSDDFALFAVLYRAQHRYTTTRRVVQVSAPSRRIFSSLATARYIFSPRYFHSSLVLGRPTVCPSVRPSVRSSSLPQINSARACLARKVNACLARDVVLVRSHSTYTHVVSDVAATSLTNSSRPNRDPAVTLTAT